MVEDHTEICLAISKAGHMGRNPFDLRSGCIDYLLVHQHGPVIHRHAERVIDAESLTRAHVAQDLGTGRASPYQCVTTPTGRNQQCVPLAYQTNHGWRMNSRAMGWAVLWPFGEDPPPDECLRSLSIGLAELACFYALGPERVVGHTEIPGTTKHADKVCPSPALNMNWLRELVACEMQSVGDATPQERGYKRTWEG